MLVEWSTVLGSHLGRMTEYIRKASWSKLRDASVVYFKVTPGLTFQLTPSNTVLMAKLLVAQLVKQPSALNTTQNV